MVGMVVSSQADAAYEAIKQDVLSCTIRPRERLTEAGLASRYDLGRAAVRSALKRLYQEALVDVLPRYGYVVAGTSESEGDDLYELQLVLEPTAARLAAGRIDAEQLRALDAQCRSHSDVRSDAEARRFLEANTRLHVAVASASGNALLARFVRILFERQERQFYASGRAKDVVRKVAHDHGTLVDLLIEGRPEAAEQAARSQVAHNQRIIHDALARRRARPSGRKR